MGALKEHKGRIYVATLPRSRKEWHHVGGLPTSSVSIPNRPSYSMHRALPLHRCTICTTLGRSTCRRGPVRIRAVPVHMFSTI